MSQITTNYLVSASVIIIADFAVFEIIMSIITTTTIIAITIASATIIIKVKFTIALNLVLSIKTYLAMNF